MRAEDEGKVTDGLVGAIKDNFNVPQETKVEGEFATPFDGLFGFGGGGEDPDPIADEDFVDSSDEANYVTVPVEKPFGMGVGDATDEGGVEVTSVQPGSNAEATGKIKTGYQLIAIDEEPVYGKTVPDIGKVVGEKEGVLRLTFFKGDSKFFYGKLGPSSSWLSKFIDGLTEY